MANPLRVRIAGAVLGAAVFMPWYSSQAMVDRDVYLGNPVPLIDWVVLAVAVVVLVRPGLAMIAGIIGFVDVAVAALLMWGDSAEGLRVTIGLGLPFAFAASVALLLFRPRTDPPREVAAEA